MIFEEILTMFGGIITDYTLRYVALGSAILGITSGALGCFTVLRKQSLFGDALAHAALPGIGLAYLFSGTKDSLLLMVGAALFAWFGGIMTLAITRTTRIKQDAALGITLSVFFGLGTVILTYLQNVGGASQGGLDRFLFGQAAALTERDVINLGILAGGCFVVLIIFFKEFKITTFDNEFGQSLGVPTKYINALLLSVIVVAVVIGLHTVGVVLMVAMLIAPAAAARQWISSLKSMVVLSAIFGGVSGIVGSMISSTTEGLSTGPVIVITITTILGISLLFSPKQGYLFQYIRKKRRVMRNVQ
jgi:manganese/zinc/iron transport system permease protein